MGFSISGIGSFSPIQRIHGFDASKCASVELDADNMSSYGIKPDDWAKVDKNGDGLITWSEFASSGMGITTIFNAYAKEAQGTNSEAYIPENQSANAVPNAQNNINNPWANNQTNPYSPQNYSPFHPSYENHPFLAQNTDFLA